MSPKPPLFKPLAAVAQMDYKPEAAQDSWQRILAFFDQYLRS